MSFQKYYGDRGGQRHGDQPLHWPGTIDGFPVRGQISADLKQRETEDVPLSYDFYSRMFELWDPAQKQEFDEVNDRVINGWYRLFKRADNWDEEKKHYRVWLEWGQIYGLMTNK